MNEEYLKKLIDYSIEDDIMIYDYREKDGYCSEALIMYMLLRASTREDLVPICFFIDRWEITNPYFKTILSDEDYRVILQSNQPREGVQLFGIDLYFIDQISSGSTIYYYWFNTLKTNGFNFSGELANKTKMLLLACYNNKSIIGVY
jgi:hypothetical protein